MTQNYKAAIKFYTKAAEQGSARAQFNLGMMYYRCTTNDKVYPRTIPVPICGGILQHHKEMKMQYGDAI